MINIIRKVVNKGKSGGESAHSSHDLHLSLSHLQKLFNEFLHSAVPLTLREQESKLYMMLPLFIKIFGDSKPRNIKSKFDAVLQFAAHVSRLMVNEVRRRAANQTNENASKAIMDFLLLPISEEETNCGWNLLMTLGILADGEANIIECMAAASLPSTLVKCLYLFYELPALEEGDNESLDRRNNVHGQFVQVLVKLCGYKVTASELVRSDDLSLLFSAVTCLCPKSNQKWRSSVADVLMTITRHGLTKEIVNYIHGKSCVTLCVVSMRRIQESHPVELVEMLVTLFCCLKDSIPVSTQLMDDFRSCHGYLFLTEFLLMLGHMSEKEPREACRNVILCLSNLVMAGHLELTPSQSMGAPYQDHDFQLPKPSGNGLSVRNLEVFQVLQKAFLKSTDRFLGKIILDSIHQIYSSDMCNYFILAPQHTLSLFIESAEDKAVEVQEGIYKLVEFVACALNWVPTPELIAISIMFKNKRPTESHAVSLRFMIRLVSFHPKYQKIFCEVGLLEVLTKCLKFYAVALKEKYDEKVKVAPSHRLDTRADDLENSRNLIPNLEKLEEYSDYPFLLMECLRLLLENNSKNAVVFRQCGGARCAHNMIPFPASRLDALKIIRELIMSGGRDDLGTLLGLMQSTPPSDVRLKLDVLNTLLRIFELDRKMRAVFRDVGGFVYVMSVLINMEGSLATPANPTWAEVEREDVLMLLRTIFHVLTSAMQDEPANKTFFMDEVRFKGLSDTLKLLGCFNTKTPVLTPTQPGEPAHTYRRPSVSETGVFHRQLQRESSLQCNTDYSSLEFDPDSSLHASSQVFQNLYNMTMDSFNLTTDCLEANTEVGHRLSIFDAPHISHPGSLLVMVDLIPSVSFVSPTVMENKTDKPSQDYFKLQLLVVNQIQVILRSEHNQQIMCGAGLPQQLLQKCEAAFVDESHPLHSPLQRIFERLASQALTPTVLREFIRLGSPLCCKGVDCILKMPEDDDLSLDGAHDIDQTDGDSEEPEEQEEQEEPEGNDASESPVFDTSDDSFEPKVATLPNLQTIKEPVTLPSTPPPAPPEIHQENLPVFRKRSMSVQSMASMRRRSLSALSPGMSPISPEISDMRNRTESRMSSLAFQDMSLNLSRSRQDSVSSSSTCSSDSDEDDTGIADIGMSGGTLSPVTTPGNPKPGKSKSMFYIETAEEVLADEDEDDNDDNLTADQKSSIDQLPSMPSSFESPRNEDINDVFQISSQFYMCSNPSTSEGAPTVVIDGVDSDQINDQEIVHSIEGNDTVILDVETEKKEFNIRSDNIERDDDADEQQDSNDTSLSESDVQLTEGGAEILTTEIDNNVQDVASENNVQNDNKEITAVKEERENVNSENKKDVATHLKMLEFKNMQESFAKSNGVDTQDGTAQSNDKPKQSNKTNGYTSSRSSSTCSQLTPTAFAALCAINLDKFLVANQQGGGQVSLTRIKCLVSMTTPRDVRMHGAADTPSFVEFDMSTDGFGCLFLPAVAPQAPPALTAVGSVVGASSTVIASVPGVGAGERAFPPQVGLTFTAWLYIEQFSSSMNDPHPVRLLTLGRQVKQLDGSFKSIPCLSISISAKDCTLVVCTEEGGGSEDDFELMVNRKENHSSEVRFLSDNLLEERQWHHVMVVLNKALIRNSTASLYVDGTHVATNKLRYIQTTPLSNPALTVTPSSPYIYAYIGTPPNQRRLSRLLWRLGPAHMVEEPLPGQAAKLMYDLGPNYVGSFQAPAANPEYTGIDVLNVGDPVVSEEKLMFGVHAHAMSVLTIAKIRKHFAKSDTRAVARELGLSTRDNCTPVRLIHNTAGHLQGPSRTFGAVIFGCSGVRTFCPKPVTKLMECVGGVIPLLGMVAMATDVESLYASVKALSCVLRSNLSAKRDMERIKGYQILALLFRRKRHLLNTHILHLTFALVGTVDTDRESNVIPNRVAFRDLLCDFEVWREAPGDIQRSLYTHFLELLSQGRELHRNVDLMQRLQVLPKLLFVLQDDSISGSTVHTIASVLSVLLVNSPDNKNLLRFGQFLVWTLPPHPAGEKDYVASDLVFENTEVPATSVVSPRKIALRNVMLELLLLLLHGIDTFAVDHSMADQVQDILGYDWLLLFLQGHLHSSTVITAARILVTILSQPTSLARFKDGLINGSWLNGTQIMLTRHVYVVAGFNVGTSNSAERRKYEVNKEACCIPGFVSLNSLLPKHVDIPEMYHLLIALMLGQSVSDVHSGVQFDWDCIYLVFWLSSSCSPLSSPESPQGPERHKVYCSDAAITLLCMAKQIVNEDWEITDNGSWKREYPETLVQFLTFLYHNVPDFNTLCTGQEFLENLVSVLFPKRRQVTLSKDTPSDSESDSGMSDSISLSSSFGNNANGLSLTQLINHPVKKIITDFLRTIITESLTPSSSGKSALIIDTILEAYPQNASQDQISEFQTEVLCAQIDYLLAGNLLAKPAGGGSNHAKVVANVFNFASKVVDRLWLGNFQLGYKVVFNFVTCLIDAVRDQNVSMESIYHSLNRTILYQLSRPLAMITDQHGLLEFFHLLTTNHKLVFSPINNEPDFIGGLCHWLLSMCNPKEKLVRSESDYGPESADESVFTRSASMNSISGEDNKLEFRHLLATSAERVWDVFIQHKRAVIEDVMKVEIPKPSFTSYPSSVLSFVQGNGSNKNLNLDLKTIRPMISEQAYKIWMMYITSEEKHKAEVLGQQKSSSASTPATSKRISVSMRTLTQRRNKKEQQKDLHALARDATYWSFNHITVVRDLVTHQYMNHLQNYQLIARSVAETWSQMEQDLTRERGLWGPHFGSFLDKWMLDPVEGPCRMRKKMCRNDVFYKHYPYNPQLESFEQPTKYKPPYSFDSKFYHIVRQQTKDMAYYDTATVGPVIKTDKDDSTQSDSVETEQKPLTTQRSISSGSDRETTDTSEEENEGSTEVDDQTIVKLLEAGEVIRSMFRCARSQGLDTAEGLFLFGQEHFYVVDGVTLLSTKEIKDIDSLPPGTHEPIIPRTSYERKQSACMKRMCSKWAYEEIREVHKRRYLLQETALEVFSSDGRNHFLVFPKSMRNKVCTKLITCAPALAESAADSVSGMKRDADVEAGVGLLNTLMGERSVTQRWERGEITNFQYLMHLNTLSGRSYNDLMQYPVFPWVLKDYTSEELDLTHPNTFRDFSLPMGAQEPDRLKQFWKRYNEWEDPTMETPPYHYGTHYSSAMIVASYLIRMEPFAQHFLRLQGGHFDLPDRLFHSVKDAWKSASRTNMADVKELIPEFFYLPEFLSNSNNFDLGVKQCGDVLGDVILPTWAKGDPREFIRIHRKALESDYVSAHLHEWIDLIFGNKQRGQPAVDAANVFHHWFYEGGADFNDIEDPLKRSANIGFINNFGQTPKQLFKRPHPPKKVFSNVEPDTPGSVNTDRLFFHNLTNLVPSTQPVKELKGPVGHIYQTAVLLAVERSKVLVPPNYSRYIAFGFGDLSMRTGYYETERVLAVYENFQNGQVLCAACPDAKTLITGGTNTLVCVWAMVKGSGKDRRPQIMLHEVLYGHVAAVTCLAVSTSYNLIVSGSEDQTCIIWDLNKLTYVRQLAGHCAPVSCIAINDLTGDIATCAGTHLYVWSVNGDLVVSENTSLQATNHIQCCAMSELCPWDEQNVILTGSLDGIVRMWGMEFYNEADKSKSPKDRSSSSLNSLDVDKSKLLKPPLNSSTFYRGTNGHENNSKDSSPIDEDYVFVSHSDHQLETLDRPKPVWKRRLILRHKLTMHTAFNRADNVAPAAVTALLVSRDHRKLFVGDGRGRIYRWSNTGSAGGIAEHWVKDEVADVCSSCEVRFSFAERRHHCRNCGKIFCARCSKNESDIQRLKIYKQVRVCNACYRKLKSDLITVT